MAESLDRLAKQVADAKTMLESSEADDLEGMVYMLFSGHRG